MSLPLIGQARSPWQRLYAAAHRRRRRWYARREKRLPVPVISVGNLHWGGTGKTPLVLSVAEHLSRQHRVAVLSRGYGRRGSGPLIVSHGDGPTVGPEVGGDEPCLLAGKLPGVAVAVGGDRFSAGRLALATVRPPPDLFLLDDGFSHLALARDLDLLAFPWHDPFGGGRLLPTGRLREPLASARHAAAAVMTGVSDPDFSGSELAERLRPFGFTGPGFSCQLRSTLAGSERPEGAVVLVSGVAAPARLHASAERAGLKVAEHLSFRDHYPYPAASLARIERTVGQHSAAGVVTTSKDLVKLTGRLASPLFELTATAVPEASFWAWLDQRMGISLESP